MEMAQIIFVATARNARALHGDAFIALAINLFQSALFVLAFMMMYSVFSPGGAAMSPIRGDFMVFIMTGVIMYMTQIKTTTAVQMADGPTAPMMQHAPMNTFIAIFSQAFSALYIQIISSTLIMGAYHVLFNPIKIHDPVGFAIMFVLAWLSGLGLGLIFMAFKPWAPSLIQNLSQVYQRINMFASGKFYVGNMLSGLMLPAFAWNPLFHIVDQTRGAIFINYVPYNSSMLYPAVVAAGLIIFGLIAEAYTRRYASMSWNKRV